MAKGLVTNTYLTNIANAIRTKLGVQTTYQPSQMAAAIASIPTGGSSTVDLSTGMRFGYSSFSTLPSQIADADWSAVTSMFQMFESCSNLTTIPLLDTSSVTNMYETFASCYYLTSMPLIDTSKVTTMFRTFYYCRRLPTVPLFDTSSCQNMQRMFMYCSALTSVPLFDTSSVTMFLYMFSGCTNLTTVPQFDTSSVTGSNMQNMFQNCTSLSNESLNNILAMCINATLITNANYMTLSYIGLTSGQAATCEDLSNWDAFVAAGWTSGY